MMKNTFRLLSLISIICVGLAFAQDGKNKKSRQSKQQSNILILKKFDPPTVGVIVRNSEKLKIPTIFSLDTPSIYQANLDVSFHKITKKWLSDHPDSLVIEVHRYPVFPQKGIEYARESYVWVIDGDENLNIQLVKNGACDAKTMLLNKEYEKDILVAKEKYDGFKQKIIEAEKTAKENKLGVWK